MSLIDRYIAEVGRHLPDKDRADIEAEIRSMLEDTIDERNHRPGQPVDDRLIGDVLEQLGDPRLLASRYAPPKRYLIGPGWYDVYINTLQRILFIALPIFVAVTFVLTLTRDPLDFINAAGEAVGGAFEVGLQIWFWTTIVFVAMERSEAVPDKSLRPDTQPWTVAQLPEQSQKRQISLGEAIMNIAMTVFVIFWIVLPALLNRFQGDNGTVSFFHPDLWNFWLPALLVLMALNLVHEIFQLKIGYWTPALTATNVILGLITIVYVAALVLTQNVVNPAFLTRFGNSTEMARLREVATWSVHISAAIIVGIYVWDIVNSIRLARQLRQSS
jgi:hypothetical protein